MQFRTPKLVKQLLTDLEVNFAILGGYPRDREYKRLPKDVDFFVYNTSPKVAFELLNELDKIFKVQVDLAYEGDDANFVQMVLQIGDDCDLIIYKEDFKTSQSILDVFDYNINQWELVNGEPVFKGKNESTLVQLKEDNALTYERKQKMIKLAKELNWDLGNCELSAMPSFLS